MKTAFFCCHLKIYVGSKIGMILTDKGLRVWFSVNVKPRINTEVKHCFAAPDHSSPPTYKARVIRPFSATDLYNKLEIKQLLQQKRNNV
jgi:hypothetical protein